MDSKVNSFSLREVGKVTPELVKSAAKKLKPDKSDPVYTFSSDCIKVDFDLLAELISIIIRSYLIHGHVTRFLLLATLVPISNNKLGCINSSKHYRSIAISSLLLKLIDWISLLISQEYQETFAPLQSLKLWITSLEMGQKSFSAQWT